ncbi:hypothetical protein O988_08801, partial [Pseudogymnoascus sp. VKM F-3808]
MFNTVFAGSNGYSKGAMKSPSVVVVTGGGICDPSLGRRIDLLPPTAILQYHASGDTVTLLHSDKAAVVAEARVGGDHEPREPHIGRDGDWRREVDVILDSCEERVIRDDYCHHAVTFRWILKSNREEPGFTSGVPGTLNEVDE